eukprot:GHRR01037104.1.p1 GENE.GHRR01037104.1~~GHRR01037104.1.p1  ORF type:complete len:375 (+),score=155.42 GHRR01037104.1:59-1183(+)
MLQLIDIAFCFVPLLQSFLKQFRQVFAAAAETRGSNQPGNQHNLVARNALLCEKLLVIVHTSVSRALFNKDQLSFAVHLAKNWLPELFPADEWATFVTCTGSATGSSSSGSDDNGATESNLASSAAVNKPSWVDENKAAAYERLATSLPNLVTAANLHDARIWAPWASATSPIDFSGGAAGDAQHGSDLVAPAIAKRLTGLQQLILVAAFRPDCLPAATSRLMCQLLHLSSLVPAPLSMKQLMEFQDSGANTAGGDNGSSHSSREAVLFITTPGADPSQELAAFAETQVGRDRLHEVAMGQGQADVALQLLKECARTGDWLLLKNLHLVVSWLPLLEKEVHNLPADTDPGFKMFFTTEAHHNFSQTLLESSLKV